MKSLKIFSIVCFLILQSDYLIAQNKKDVTQNTGISKNTTVQAETIKQRKPEEIDNQSFNKKDEALIRKSDSLRIRKKSQTSNMKSKKISVCKDTVMFKHEYEPIIKELEELKKDKETLQKDLQSMKEKIAHLEKIDVDKFLNLRDISIFSSNFLALSSDEIPVRSQDFYQLIQNIHDLDNILTTIDQMKFLEFQSIKDRLTEAGSKIDTINSYATANLKITDYLSEEQKQFFRGLVTRYNNSLQSIQLTGSNNE